MAALAIGLVVAGLWSISVGQFGVSSGQSLRSFWHILTGLGSASELDVVLWEVRLPRVVLAAIVGAGLALAGVALQAIFGNPLAEPGLIGVSSGAAVGASLAVVLGAGGIAGASVASSAFLTNWAIAGTAFAGGIIATVIVGLSAKGNRDIARVILVGVAVNAVAGGLVSFLTYIASTSARDRIVFWQMGSFASADWSNVIITLLLTLPAFLLLWFYSTKLDILSLGEAQARHLGVNVVALRRTVIGITALVVAAGVAFSGIIVFIGLVVPHALRLILGPQHRVLIPACFLGGALATTLADLAARTLINGADLPLGMLTSIIGGPIFFWLLIRSERAVKR
ncbi:FecCD family ABC transporter permease [Corynebacterium urogenitale]|nr:iron chelate uptake ABC transporter family permease subunit [Corynebacterium urogenitale]